MFGLSTLAKLSDSRRRAALRDVWSADALFVAATYTDAAGRPDRLVTSFVVPRGDMAMRLEMADAMASSVGELSHAILFSPLGEWSDRLESPVEPVGGDD